MSIEQSDVIDIISTNRVTGDVSLTISDHLDWSDSAAHQLLLQKKLNYYLAFVKSGEILDSYPKARGRRIVLSVAFKHPADEAGRAFLSEVRSIVERAGFGFQVEVQLGGRLN